MQKHLVSLHWEGVFFVYLLKKEKIMTDGVSDKKFYITTAIAYPNGKPHMGHALEIIIADVLARSYRLMGEDVEFQTWTDEHGIKNRRTAQQKWKEIHNFLDENVDAFKNLYQELKISYTTFIRTSDEKLHYTGAQNLWTEIAENQDLEKKSFEGLYCESCEAFKTEKDLVDGKCPDHPTKKIEKIQEENYFFKLSKYKDKITEFIQTDRYKIYPDSRKSEILAFLEDARDVSFSRQKTALPRGVPVPNDPDHVMYVRCDALSNYLTGQGYGHNNDWKTTRPADIHIIGKDILRFHAAFWPAMLYSANISLPKTLLAHGFLTLNGKKMSKSTGNVIDPMEPIQKYGRDAVVFNLLYDVALTDDGDFSMERLDGVYNSMLIGAWGNLVNRVTKLGQKWGVTVWNLGEQHDRFLDYSLDHYFWNIKRFNTKKALEQRYKLVQKANEFITVQEPWKKYKEESSRDQAIKDIEFLLYVVKNLAILSSPILVDGFTKLQSILWNEELSQINTTWNIDTKKLRECFLKKQFSVHLDPQIIYPRIEE